MNEMFQHQRNSNAVDQQLSEINQEANSRISCFDIGLGVFVFALGGTAVG